MRQSNSYPWLSPILLCFVVALSVSLFSGSASVTAALSLPPGFISESVVTGLSMPTAIDWAPDGRMFIAQKDGRVRVFENGALLPTDFIDISDQVNSHWDRGLLGIAVHPAFTDTPYVYLLFTYDPPELPGAPFEDDGPDGAGERVSRLIRVRADPNNTNVALPGSELVLLGTNSTFANIGDPADKDGASGIPSCDNGGTPVEDCLPSDSPSHGIGTVIFGIDGESLYVGNGDSASFYVTEARTLRTLDVDSLAGKVLCIHPQTGEGCDGNPFFDGDPTHNRSKVWSYGMRNPFRFTVHPVTNEPFIGDVGWSEWEEINTGKGKNFGWPCYEGDDSGSARQPGYESDPNTEAACKTLYDQGLNAVQAPLYAYNHSGEGAAVMAGAFYQGTDYPPEYQGALFIADYNRDWIKYLTDVAGNPTVHDFAESISDGAGLVHLTVGPDTNLYYVNLNPYGQGEVRRIRYTADGNTPPTAQASATPTNGPSPLTVNFSSAGSLDPDGDPLSYEWAFGDTMTSTVQHPSHSYTVPGDYTAVLTVTDSYGASGTDSVEITVGNTAPIATITKPEVGKTYSVSDTVLFSGTGLDAEDGSLPGSSLGWEVLLHHNEHVHPDFFNAAGTEGSLIAPDHGDHTWLELCLTATDSGGLQDSKCVALHPNTVIYTFDTQPSGLRLIYSSISYTTPFTVETIVNARRSIIAPARQGELSFFSWSDGGERSHTITVGSTPLTFVAGYRWLIQLPNILHNHSPH